MNHTMIFINSFVLVCLIVSFLKDKTKTKKALKVAVKSFFKMLPMVLIIIIFIGLLLGLMPPEKISQFIGEQAGWGGFLLIAFIGAIMHIPSLLSFPLAASFLEDGAAIAPVVVFITTLTMIGIVTLPLEIKFMGKKFTLLRNGISFIFALCIALIMGAIL
ncbi:permease [candidate division KSB1 bacterium]|nr:permease [candidate division KSB1 bacterium]